MNRRTFLAAVGGLCIAGCSPRRARELKPILQLVKPTDVFCGVFDKSGSYEHSFNQKAYPELLRFFRQFRRDLAGEEGTQIILANISSEPQGPFFRGTLAEFGKTVRNAGDFRSLLAKYGGASRVFDSITETCDLMEGGIKEDSRAFLGLWTDFDDNLSAAGGEVRMVEALSRLARKGVSCGCYWVPSAFMPKAESYMRRAGFKNYVVGWIDDASITLPKFER